MEELSRLQGDTPFGWPLALWRLLTRRGGRLAGATRPGKPVQGPEPPPWSLLRW